jgi:hypothetical protein
MPGMEPQILANVWLAFETDLDVVPVLNKIDLPGRGFIPWCGLAGIRDSKALCTRGISDV